MRDGCREGERAPREGVQVERRVVKLQPWRQRGSCDLREDLGLGWRGSADDWGCGSERAHPMNLVRFLDVIECSTIAY